MKTAPRGKTRTLPLGYTLYSVERDWGNCVGQDENPSRLAATLTACVSFSITCGNVQSNCRVCQARFSKNHAKTGKFGLILRSMIYHSFYDQRSITHFAIDDPSRCFPRVYRHIRAGSDGSHFLSDQGERSDAYRGPRGRAFCPWGGYRASASDERHRDEGKWLPSLPARICRYTLARPPFIIRSARIEPDVWATAGCDSQLEKIKSPTPANWLVSPSAPAPDPIPHSKQIIFLPNLAGYFRQIAKMVLGIKIG